MRSVWVWRLDEGSCTGCGICRDVCPEGAIRQTRDMGLPEPVPGACTGCGGCVAECPFDAIVIKNRNAVEGIDIPVD